MISLTTLIATTLIAQTAVGELNFEAAWNYAQEHRSHNMLVWVDGKTRFEKYSRGNSQTPYPLASGTKSFVGPMVVLMSKEGLLNLDEPASKTLTEWANDSRSKITIRQLLQLTSGLKPMPNLSMKHTTADALGSPLTTQPGNRFVYGPVHYLSVTELIARKLSPSQQTPMSYLKAKVLDPISMKLQVSKTPDGAPNFAGGGSASSSDWLKYGEWLLKNHKVLKECFSGSSANPAYGLTFWLPASNGVYTPNGGSSKYVPRDAFMAAGLGGQILVIIPSQKTIIIRQGPLFGGKPFKPQEFLDKLFG